MKVTVPIEIIEEFFKLLHQYHFTTEEFVNGISTNNKYQILTLIMMVRSDYFDFEEAHAYAIEKVAAHELNEYFMKRSSDNWQTLHAELQDVIAIYKREGWEWFELGQSEDDDENGEED